MKKITLLICIGLVSMFFVACNGKDQDGAHSRTLPPSSLNNPSPIENDKYNHPENYDTIGNQSDSNLNDHP